MVTYLLRILRFFAAKVVWSDPEDLKWPPTGAKAQKGDG
jgi:hypothetical protein